MTTSNYDAEFGSVAGALMQATTKSGTNQVHGTGFEYLQNDIFDSANPFTQLKPPTPVESVWWLAGRADQEE